MPSTTLSREQNRTLRVLEWAHDELGLTWDEVAGALDASTRTLQRWREGETAPSRENLRALEELDELRFWLETLFEDDPDAATEWMSTRLVDLRGKTPLQALRAGHTETLNAMLATVHAGAHL